MNNCKFCQIANRKWQFWIFLILGIIILYFIFKTLGIIPIYKYDSIVNFDNPSNQYSKSKPVPKPADITLCKDESEGSPIIISLSASSGTLETKIEINGCNFSGFEGDKNVWIKNAQGIKGIIYGETESTSKLLKITLKSPLCQKDNSYSGLPCNDWLILSPGIYKIYTMPWGKKSNEVEFTILK